ncbi:tetratricopeptide repeat protein [Dyadobacter helix]|nr:ABC transporter substrate-binding protein [Dyadobacter sp. CECT 9275]
MHFRATLFFLILFFFFTGPGARGQLLNDPAAIKTIQGALDKIYNYEFAEAEKIINQVEGKYPGHPVIHILDSFILFWRYLPIKDNPVKAKEYVQKLNACLSAVEKRFGKDSRDPEAVFYVMVARGYLAMMYNYKGEMLNAAGEGKKAYNAFLEGLKLISKNPEFYFTSGMYNYYVVIYPEIHPIVKPLMVFFKKGDKALGMKQVETGTRLGTITKAESCFYLSHLYLKYEDRPEKAVVYMQRLVDQYPQNPIYLMKYIESLVLAGKYDEAESLMPPLKRLQTGFFPASWHTFQAIILEKRDKNDTAAQREYLAALRLPHDDQYTEEYTPMAYAGLARIAKREGNQSKAKDYYKKCLDRAEYTSLIKEARSGR